MYALEQLVRMLAGVPQLLTDDDMNFLSSLVRRERRFEDGQTLLHVACFNVNNITQLATIHLLLRAGADANAVDAKGNAPLHLINYRNGEMIDAGSRLLLKFGAHHDRANKLGQTVLHVWEARGRTDRPRWYRKIVPRLLCLSATVIRSNRIHYVGEVPVILCSYVEMH